MDLSLQNMLGNIRNICVGVVGDLCLDVYWHADMRLSELSPQTPYYVLPVTDERMSLGGAGNVAANLCDLSPKKTMVFGVVGRDWRGAMIRRLLAMKGISQAGVIRSELATNAYCMVLRRGLSPDEHEGSRIDFTYREPLPRQHEKTLIESLENAAGSLDVLCVADQQPLGLMTPNVIQCIAGIAQNGVLVVVDSRRRIGLFAGLNMILKMNHFEGAVAVGMPPALETDYLAQKEVARALLKKFGGPVCMTLGSGGCIYMDQNGMEVLPAVRLTCPVDTIGTGDTFLSMFSLALATGAAPKQAARWANLAAGVTAQKIGITGTASQAEILRMAIHQ